ATYTLSLHDALPILARGHHIDIFHQVVARGLELVARETALHELVELKDGELQCHLRVRRHHGTNPDLEDLLLPRAIRVGEKSERSEEHTSELQSPDQ